MPLRTILTGGLVWDNSDAAPRPADIVVEGGAIVAAGPGLDGDVAVDLDGATVLPGLFDCHVHVMLCGFDLGALLRKPIGYRYFEAARNLRLTVATGITSVRDAGGADAGLRKALHDGLIAGPRLQIAVAMMTQTGGHGDFHLPCGITVDPLAGADCPSGIVDGADEARRVARTMIRAGADVLKVATTGGVLSPDDDPRHTQLQADELLAIVAEADAVDIPVMAHAQGAEGVKRALNAGVRSIEHGIYLDDEAIELMLDRGAFLVPTLTAPHAVVRAADAGAPIAAESVRKAREVIEAHRESFTRAIAAGVRIAMGTDSGVIPHGENLEELRHMQDAGLSAAETLRAATCEAADLLGVADRLGSIEAGKRADFVVVAGDAFDLATLAERVRDVWVDGVSVARRPTTD